MINKKIQGKKNREKGRRFEAKVRKDLESKGWIVNRWTNQVELKIFNKTTFGNWGHAEYGKLIPAKSNRFNMRTTGFPDYLCFRIAEITTLQVDDNKGLNRFLKNLYRQIKNAYEVIGVECKSLGYLDKEERAKCEWLLKNNIFSRILIARKGKKRGEVEYVEFH